MGKANNHTPVVVGRKSDKLIVPEKQPNKADLSVAEVVEESGLTKSAPSRLRLNIYE